MRIHKANQEIHNLADWHRLAPPADPIGHWVAGRSAMELARAWLERAPHAPPPEIATLLRTHEDTQGLVIENVEPEACIAFDGRGGPRQADLAIKALQHDSTVAISVEGKADEPFGTTVSETFSDSLERLLANARSGGVARLIDLAESLLPPQANGCVQASRIRYQLLTGVAGTLAHATLIKARKAIFLVHEFHTRLTMPQNLAANAQDLNNFVSRLTRGAITQVDAGHLYGPFPIPGEPLFPNPVPLYIGKAVRVVPYPAAE